MNQCKNCKKSYTNKYILQKHYVKCIQKINEVINNKCLSCNKEFSTIYTLKNHINKGCEPDNFIKIDNKFECNYCNKLYSSKQNLIVHQSKSCKIKKEEDNNNILLEKNKILEESFQKQIDDLKRFIIEQNKNIIINPTNPTTNTVTNNNYNNNSHNINSNNMNNIQINNNNINLYSLGKEDLSKLSDEEKQKICTSGTYYPIIATELIQANKKYPEYNNVLITDMNSDTGYAYINNEWTKKSCDEILNSLLEVNKNHTKELIHNTNIDDKLKIKIENTMDEINNNENKDHQKVKVKKKICDVSDKMIKDNMIKNE